MTQTLQYISKHVYQVTESKIDCFIALNLLLINVKVMQGLLLQYVGIMIRWMLCKHTKTVKSKIMELAIDTHAHAVADHCIMIKL